MGLNVIRFQFRDQIRNPPIKVHLLGTKMKGIKKLYFLTPDCNFKSSVARGRVGIRLFYRNEACQSVSRDTGHDTIIGTLCIVEKNASGDTPYSVLASLSFSP